MINWNKAVQPLLGGPISSPPCGFTTKDLKEVILAVNENSATILDHDPRHECFFSSYMALVGHQVANSFDNVEKSVFREFVSACGVLMEFCLRRLQNFEVHCAVPQKNLMQLVSALCHGSSPFVRVDVITFTAMLKSAELPMIVHKQETGSENKEEVATASPDFISEMSKTFEMYSSGIPMDSSGKIIDKTLLLKENVTTLSRLTKTYSMDEIYRNLSYLKRYMNRFSDLKQGKSLVLPDSTSAATTIRNGLGPLASNISIILQAVSLPTMESLTSEKIENLSKLGLGCVYAGLSVVAAMTISSDGKSTGFASTSGKGKEPDYEAIADSILCEVFDIFSTIEGIFSSKYCPSHVLSNFQMMAVYIISQGLAIIIQQQSDLPKESTQHGNQKVDNIFTLSLAVTLVGILEKILTNAEQETDSNIGVLSPDVLDVFAPNTSMTRLAAITEKCDVIPMLIRLVHSNFLHAVSVQKNTSASNQLQQVSSDLPADDSGASDDESLAQAYDLRNSENEYSSCDDDVPNGSFGFSGGPILGEWFLRILNGQDDETVNPSSNFLTELPDARSDRKFKLPDEAIIAKESTNRFLEKANMNDLLGMIVNLINTNFLSSKSKHAQDYICKHLTQESIVQLVNLVNNTDVYPKNGRKLMSLLHSLISSNVVNGEIEAAVLRELDIDSPTKQLFANQKPLSILFKILFQHQVQDKKEGKDHGGTVDFIASLIEYYRNPEMSDDGVMKSIDVTVVQMGLFLFHTLTDDAKRKIFKSVIHGLSACKEDDKVPIATSRFVVLVEYFMHHYSRPSVHLFSHLQHNLITVHLEQDNFEAARKGLLDFDIRDRSRKYLPFLPSWGETAVLRTPVAPMSDAAENEFDEISVSDGELLYEVSDVGLGNTQTEGGIPALELDPVALQVMKSCDVEIADLHKIVVNALNAGCKLRFQDGGKETSEKMLVLTKSFLVYNFQIAWRLCDKIQPLLEDENIENSDLQQNSFSYFLASAHTIGKALASESDDKKRKDNLEKLTDLFTRLARMYTAPESMAGDLISKDSFPTFTQIMTLDCVLHELLNAFSTDDKQDLLTDIFPVVMKILHYFSKVCRSYVLLCSGESDETLPLYSAVMQADVSKLSPVESGSFDFPSFPNALKEEVLKWDTLVRMKIPDRGKDCGTEKVLYHHLKALNDKNSYLKILQYVTESIHLALAKISPWDTLDNRPSDMFSTKVLFSLLTDTLMSKFVDTKSLEADRSTEKYKETVYYHALNQSYQFIVKVKEDSERKYSLAFVTFLENLIGKTDAVSAKKAFYHFFISAKDSVNPTTKKDPKSLQTSYEGINLQYTGDLVSLLLSVAPQQICNQAAFSFMCKMFEGATGENPDPHLAAIVAELDKLQLMPPDDFEKWLSKFTNLMLFSRSADSSVSLQLVSYLTHPESPVNHDLGLKILESSIAEVEKHIKSEPITDFLTMLMTLAEANQGQGHLKLFQSSLNWLEQCRNELVTGGKLTEFSPEQTNYIINVCELLLLYTMDVLVVFHGIKSEEQCDSACEDDDVVIHSDELQETSTDKQSAKTTSEYELDEDEDLYSKLCTYTVTQKEFMNQHWYHCHTCDMTEGIGVCTVCAKVCHKDHDLAYAKYGSFFCDCGAKGSKACRALTKRDPIIENAARVLSASSSSATIVPSASSSALSVKTKKPVAVGNSNTSVNSAAEGVGTSRAIDADLEKKHQRPKRMKLCKNLDGCREEISNYLNSKEGQESCIGLLLNIISDIEKIVGSDEYRSVTPNSMAHALKVMTKLHEEEKKNETVETLLVPTLGSQEGAFENVKANFTGEQGQTIRQLINTRMISRIAMSCLSSGFGRRHHLAVSHEKNKLAILQLSALLKQADASKRKLTLNRLSTTLLPFTIVTLSNNPCNEEVLAVCGLKDCHILTFTSSGSVNEHLTLHPQLTAGNYIIKTIWLPGSSKEIALITAKFIKIYDLSKDVLAPTFHFLLPTGKVRDATFMTPNTGEESTPWLIIMSSSGYMYDQPLYEHCSAAHGPFYVTGTLSITDESLTEKNDLVGGGGISVYYSHVLQLLFFSYGNGKNFAATLNLDDEKALKLFPITFKGSNGKMNNGSGLALYAWNEVTGHPGLLTCFTHTTGLPIAVMVDPEKIQLQELKTTTSKAKIQDIVAVRHSLPGDIDRSTIIALCEDGSLKIYLANQETTGFWLDSNLQPRSVFSRTHFDIGKKGGQKGAHGDSAKSKDLNQVEPVFPVDFFEDCQLIPSSDLEFGGDSLLQVYNPNQIKNRLANQDMYIVSKKTFSIEVTIKNKSMIVTGIRMQVGHRGGDFAPTHIYVGDRYISLGPRLKKPRWFDFPLTREESINFRNKLVITCGSSVHQDDYNIVDSIKLYGKTKETFGWQEEDAKAATIAEAQDKAKALSGGKSEKKYEGQVKEEALSKTIFLHTTDLKHPSPVNKVLLACIGSLNCTFGKGSNFGNIDEKYRSQILDLSSKLLVRAVPHTIHRQVKKLIMNALPTVEEYHKFKDNTMLKHISETLKEMKPDQATEKTDEAKKTDWKIFPDVYQFLLMELSRISVRRPSNLVSAAGASQMVTATQASLSTHYCTHMQDLLTILMQLIRAKPKHRLLAPFCLPGIQHVESSVQAYIDIVHSVAMTMPSMLEKASKIYYDLLTSEHVQVSSAARSALIRLLHYPIPDHAKPRSVRSNSKSSDTAPSTRSNSPPTTMSSQAVATSSGSGGVLVLTSNQSGQVFPPSSSYISSQGAVESMNDEDDDEDDDDDSDGDEFDDEDGPLDEVMMMEEDSNGIAPSLHRDEQLRAMQELEENMNQAQMSAVASQNDENGNIAGSSQSQQANVSQMQSEMQRLQELMQASENANNFFNQEDNSSLEEMIMDVQEDEYPEFDADDEAMVEFAIALSLQQSEGSQSQQQESQQTVSNDNNNDETQGGSSLEELMHAIGEEMPVPPQMDSAPENEQQAPENPSVLETKEDTQQAPINTTTGAGASTTGHQGIVKAKENSKGEESNLMQEASQVSTSVEDSGSFIEAAFDKEKIETMRCSLLDEFLGRLPEILKLEKAGHSIPYFQVLITLTKLLDPRKETQRDLLEKVVSKLVGNIEDMKDSEAFVKISERSALREMIGHIIRCLDILMSRARSHSGPSEHEVSLQHGVDEDDTVSRPVSISSITAKVLVEHDTVQLCIKVLDDMLEQHWSLNVDKNKPDGTTLTKLLKTINTAPVPDYAPIISSQYVKAYVSDVCDTYPEIMTERLLHLLCRFKKYYDSEKMAIPEKLQHHFVPISLSEGTFCWILSDYMLSTDIPVIKKFVRKALFYLCGSKERYREVRDAHALSRYIENITETWTEADVLSKLGTVNFPYDQLISIVKYLEACSAVATKRTGNWQNFCLTVNKNCLEFLLELSIYITEDVATSVLELLICAVSVKKDKKESKKAGKTASASGTSGQMAELETKTAETVSDSSPSSTEMAMKLSQKFLSEIKEKDLHAFLIRFLLEINTTSVRWNAHEFVLQLFKNNGLKHRTKLVNTMWSLWPSVPSFGRKAVQFVDLLGYLSIENGLDPNKSELFTDAAFGMLKRQNMLLTNHPNSMLYMQLLNYVDFDGYFLESNPCLICNQPEVPYSSIKLSSVKSDTKYTTTQQIIKLVGSYSLQKVTVKITDIKQTKMIRTVSLLYNNKKVPAIIELKNKPELWNKAKQVVLMQGQTEVKFDLPLPVIATNLMLEFSDFYENVSATTETLQCPRCSASVQANPGICGNCGENVFQCHKCRSINYDEKDPFLCNVCGFSKHAKFDVTLYAKPCCAVDTIENEEARKKTVGIVSVLLEKADLAYYQMLAYKPDLEQLLLQIEKLTTETSRSATKVPTSSGSATQAANTAGPSRVPVLASQPVSGLSGGAAALATASHGVGVNVHIRQLAQKYCVEAKNSFEELSKIMKTVLASRKEIVEYDQRQRIALTGGKNLGKEKLQYVSTTTATSSTKNCYGCAAATAKQCIILLRALATDKTSRKRLVGNGLITELVHVSLRRGNVTTRKQVQQLIGQLVKNDHEASAELNDILFSRLSAAMLHHNQDLFPATISSEMNLLASIQHIRDNCWQLRLRTVIQLFQMSVKMQSPAVVENITLPCLKILQSKAALTGPTVSSKLIDAAKNSKEITVDAQAWLAGEKEQDFAVWKQQKIMSHVVSSTAEDLTKAPKTDVRNVYLMEKYARLWRNFVATKKNERLELSKKIPGLPHHRWLRQMLFCKSSRAVRQAACLIVKSVAENSSRKGMVIDMLTSYLDELSSAGEAALEFFQMYQELIQDRQWKVHLASRDILPFIGRLIDREIANLLKLEDTTLMLDLQQGYSLKELTELLSELVHVPYIRQRYKGSLVGTVLNGYLSMRKLVIQRTTIIDDTQELLLELLEDLTTGTELETKAFMAVCIETINKYELDDIRTPQFIFERLANIIFPEESNTNEFFMSLDKDPLQEDFLQGRMVGNPYSSTEPGLGPLMRDVKNKICRDCDLVALLEDDNGMELLVNNKIISLDLTVRDVYNKVWLPSHSEDEAMRVVYRMRGLLGEATEDIIDKLDPEVDARDEEEVYKMASVLSQCGGIEAMLQRLDSVHNLTYGRQLVDAIMKLMTYIVRLKSNRKYLMRPELNTLNVLLGTLNLGLQSGEDGVPLVEQLLQVMDRVLQETSDDKAEVFTGDKEKLTLLLQQIDSELVRHHSKILRGLMRIIPFLSFGDPDLMQMLIDHFKSALDFEKFDEDHTEEDAVYLDCFCEISTGIEDNENGDQLKDLIIKNDIVESALSYIRQYVPQHKNFEASDWKSFVSRPALPYCLRLLAGLSAKHNLTQLLIGQTSIPDLHRLEQVSTQESIGSLAENVLEAISENPQVSKTIKEVRRETRAEKKRLAMAVRKKELGALGMKTNSKGQVVTQTPLLKQIGDLVEESGLTCIICREGYKFEPKKVLGVYTFSRRCTLEEFENKPRKQQGYSTVSHFNVVHYDCHTSAVRAARGREEWESAMLQNANTKCNGLLPLWGPHVSESSFATCLARHNTYIQDATGYKEPNVTSTVHDLKLLFLRFANEKSFSEETGGGGPQSNIHIIPYILHMAQYVINTTRSSAREERNVSIFLEAPKESWVETSYSVDGPLYITALSVFVCDSTKWMTNRLLFLKRLLVLCQTRQSSASIITKLTDRAVKPYETYKPFFLFWAMIDLVYTELLKHAPKVEGSDTWAHALQVYIRNNDIALQETTEKMMLRFQQDYLPIASLEEFVDVAGIHADIEGSIQSFMTELFESLPK